MPSDSQDIAPSSNQTHVSDLSIANVRILRLALGTALSMLFSQVVNWPMSFIAPVLTMFILALPMPAMNLANGIKFILVFVVSIYTGLMFLPFMLNQKVVGVLLLGLALYHTFYFTARGGSAIEADRNDYWSHGALGGAELYLGHHERALSALERAVALGPSSADMRAVRALVLNYMGRPEEGLADIELALRLNPHHPDWYLLVSGSSVGAGG